MKKLRRRYNQEFKTSVVAELEGVKSPAQIARERGFIRVYHPDGEMNMQITLKKAFGSDGKPCKYEARIAELKRMLWQNIVFFNSTVDSGILRLLGNLLMD